MVMAESAAAVPLRVSAQEQDIPKDYRQTEVGLVPTDWTITSLEQISAFITKGSTPTTYGFHWQQSGILFLRSECVSERGLDLSQSMFISSKAHSFLRRSEVQDDDILVTITGNVGRAVMLSGVGKANLNQHIARVRITSDGVDPRFAYHYLSKPEVRAYFTKITTGQAYPQISLKQVRETSLPLPSLREQTVIADALSDADALIEALEQLIEKKRLIKQGAMQELLSGSKRLPGFSGEWQTKSVGDLLTIRHGKSQKDVVEPNGQYPILATGGEIGRSRAYLHDKPSVLIGRKGTIDRPQFMDRPFWTVDTLFYSDVKEGNSAKFLYYAFLLIDWRCHNEASGVPSLNAKTIEQIELLVPPEEEQATIASTLTDIEEEIGALEARLEKARQIKQGMMQELLTGRVRLV